MWDPSKYGTCRSNPREDFQLPKQVVSFSDNGEVYPFSTVSRLSYRSLKSSRRGEPMEVTNSCNAAGESIANDGYDVVRIAKTKNGCRQNIADTL